jgi:hypothetical protein
MIGWGAMRVVASLGFTLAFAVLLGDCSGVSLPSFSSSSAEPTTTIGDASSIQANELIGKWGLASFQNPNEQAHAEAAAKTQCRQPYEIRAGANGGVVMHLPDQASPHELSLKGGPGGKRYIGPPGPAGSKQDREIVSFNDPVLITRFVDERAAARYGNTVYFRCGNAA